MKQITATWFESKVVYEKVHEDGLMKKVTETYVVDALSFTEAEKRITEEMSSYISGEFKIKDLSIAQYGEIFFSEDDSADKWYKAKLAFITIDEKTEREKRSNVLYLVQAASLDSAIKSINDVMSSSMNDYASVAIAETSIVDVFKYEKK